MTSLNEELERVLSQRTRYVTAVFEDLFQAHNGAAVIRACECFGVQDLHVISNENPFRVDETIAAGADAFVDVHRWEDPAQDNTTACLSALKEKGYRILATSLRPGCIDLPDLDLDQPMALVFGTELHGLSDKAHDLADDFLRIPMFGFTQSFNISVSTALSLFELTRRLRRSDLDWRLSEEEQATLRARFQALTKG